MADARFALANRQNDPDADWLSNNLEKLADFFFFYLLACIHNIEYIISRIPILEYDINNTGEWINVLLLRNTHMVVRI